MTDIFKKYNAHSRMLQLLWLFRWRLSAGLLLMALTVVFQLSLPKVIAYFIDHLSTPNVDMLNELATLLLILLVLQAAAMAGRYYLFESTGHLIVHYVREQLYRNILAKPVAFFDKHHVGELTSRLSSDVGILHETLTMGLAIFLRAVLLFIGALIMMLSLSSSLVAPLLVLIPISLLIASWIGKQFRMRSALKQSALAACSRTSLEYLSNIRLVKAFSQQSYSTKRYVEVNQRSLNVSLTNTALFAKFQSGSLLLTFGALLLTLWLGAAQISAGEISIGELTAFILYASMLSMSASTLSDFWGEWMRTAGATSEIFSLLEEDLLTENEIQHTVIDGAIQFENVSFSYPERAHCAALHQLTFRIKPGEKIALVGASGAGKSTVVALILGFYRITKGRISLGSKDVTDLESVSVRRQVAVVEQEPSLFSGSIYENIAFAVSEREVDECEVLRAAKLACADEFIVKFPLGYQTQVGEYGVQLSGGQKQRIAIARAILRDPKILILDEATSALDATSEHSVQRALDYLMRERTTIIIAHRFSTILKVDRVLVLDRGALVEEGHPMHLSTQKEGVFYQLMSRQLMPTSENILGTVDINTEG